MKKRFTVLLLTVFLLSNSFGQDNQQLENAWWQWVVTSNISDKDLKEVAPHFPNARFLANTPENLQSYEDEVYKWMMLWGQEYEDLINHPRLASTNEYNDGTHVEVYSVPRFMMPLETRDKPVFNAPKNIEEEVEQILHLQAWYFVFHPELFEKEFGFIPEFPENVSGEKYRNDVLGKIEAAEKGLTDPDIEHQ